MPTTEHVLLESDFRQVPDLQDARKVHARIEFRSRLRRRVLQLEIIDYYYLSVRSHSRSILLEYVLDLRFVVVSGRARISLRRMISSEVISIEVAGDEPMAVDMPTMWVHNITNVGDTELVTIFWADQLLDSDRPDQYPERVFTGVAP